LYAFPGIQLSLPQGEGFGITGTEVLGHVDPGILPLAPGTEHVALEGVQNPLLDQLSQTVMANHAIADDDQLLLRSAVCRHVSPLVTRCCTGERARAVPEARLAVKTGGEAPIQTGSAEPRGQTQR